MTEKFNRDIVYGLEGEQLNRLGAVMDRLGSPETLSFDQRRDLTHKIWLVLNEASPVFILPGEPFTQ